MWTVSSAGVPLMRSWPIGFNDTGAALGRVRECNNSTVGCKRSRFCKRRMLADFLPWQLTRFFRSFIMILLPFLICGCSSKRGSGIRVQITPSFSASGRNCRRPGGKHTSLPVSYHRCTHVVRIQRLDATGVAVPAPSRTLELWGQGRIIDGRPDRVAQGGTAQLVIHRDSQWTGGCYAGELNRVLPGNQKHAVAAALLSHLHRQVEHRVVALVRDGHLHGGARDRCL